MTKFYATICTALILLLANTVLAQNFEQAGDYLSYINKQQENVMKKYLSYNSAIAHGKKAKKVENLRSKLLDEVQEARMNINSLPSFKGDKAFRDSAVSFMKMYYSVLNEDYSKILNMEEIAEQSYDLMEAYLKAQELAGDKLQAANEAVRAAQKKFAEQNNIILQEGKSDISSMMQQVGEVNEHYNTIYLIFFKSYKQEVYMLDAIEKKNVIAIEQNRTALLQYAKDGLAALEASKGYKGDESIIRNCKQFLTFLVSEAGDKMGPVTNLFMTQERFDKMKKDFEKKSDPTQEDVDNYNKGVKDINAASDNYNNTMKQLYEQRANLLNNWNEAVRNFMDNHMPTYS
jgi:hypothetical protein